MKEEIKKTLGKMQTATEAAPSPNTSKAIPTPKIEPLGDPNCEYCRGAGYLRWDVPLGHEKFGKVEACVCRASDKAETARNRLYALSSLEHLRHLTFENFRTTGNPKAKNVISQPEQESLHKAMERCLDFARDLNGWILLEGTYGCGKTHLAAAIANQVVSRGKPTLFITVPDLLDSLRMSYDNPETTFEARFNDIRNAELLVMDDFGTQNATGWGQEKLFQIINYRYINKLPTVITTNLILDEIEGRIRSRLQDDEMVEHIRILTLDYRHPDETSNPGLSMLAMSDIKTMTFKNWEDRENEIGHEIVTVTTTERKGSSDYRSVKDKEIVREKVTAAHIKRLREAHDAAARYADEPNGWLVLLGPSYAGKTHLAAAIGHYRMGMGGQAVMADVSVLLDYLKQTFRPSIDVSFDRRFYEIRTTPLLILDGFKESNMGTAWAEDKLYQILNHRFYNNLPTVITSMMTEDHFAVNHPNLWNKLLDPTKCRVCAVDMPPYRRQKPRGRAKKTA
ncbi:MAG: ATP-binding protein [Anaerolineae bacterium]|nr:ATP-binding protein [Anaerolineae bacterium]